MLKDCIFCKIIAKEVPGSTIKDTPEVLVIKDINPRATIHYLIIPKVHFDNLGSAAPEQLPYINKAIEMANDLSKELNIPAFRLVINNGKDAGQCVFHFHVHFLSGKSLSSF